MLSSRISNISNVPITLAEFKAHAGGITHTLNDASIQIHINASVIWIAEQANLAVATFSVTLKQDIAVSKLELLYSNISSIDSVKNLETDEDVSFEANADNTIITTDSEQPLLVTYTCQGTADDFIKNSMLDYANVRYTGQTDPVVSKKLRDDLAVIKDSFF